jgi:hypothetical protein
MHADGEPADDIKALRHPRKFARQKFEAAT